MNELSIEEKAKRYDEALKVLHKYDGANIMFSQSLKEEMFPELAEPEDERVRKELTSTIRLAYDCGIKISIENRDKYLAWLEKQGEQRERLINKACNVLVDCIEDFMFRRMEVWSEECKKQTLENIRKTLEE